MEAQTPFILEFGDLFFALYKFLLEVGILVSFEVQFWIFFNELSIDGQVFFFQFFYILN